MHLRRDTQVFRFSTHKTERLFLQRKNPRKIAWTVLYRRMHKKGLTEEVAKKRSRKTVKHQRGIVGADLAAIAARRNQTAAARTEARTSAIQKAKAAKKEKEGKKTAAPAKVCGFLLSMRVYGSNAFIVGHWSPHDTHRAKSQQGPEGRQGCQRPLICCLFALSYSLRPPFFFLPSALLSQTYPRHPYSRISMYIATRPCMPCFDKSMP